MSQEVETTLTLTFTAMAGYGSEVASDELIDWSVAGAAARRLVRPGPTASRKQADLAVAQLRESAAAAQRHVRAFADLDAPDDGAPVLVVDRIGWINANLDVVRTLSGPLVEKIHAWREGIGPGGLRSATNTMGAKFAGAELGSLLAYLSSKVLGQYDPFGVPQGPNGRTVPGRLLLVAPNVVQVERKLGVDPGDFRLWICLHEETHRVQFGAVPWLREHILGEIGTLIAELDVEPAVVAERMRATLRSIVGAATPGRHAEEPADRVGPYGEPVTPAPRMSLVDVVRTPEQRVVLDRLTAVMTLLEGHATYVMDGVGPLVVPSVAEISREFGRNRSRTRLRPDTLLRRVLGLDAKLRQYRDGERFVRQVVEEVGITGLNRVWTSPNTLPTQAEIVDPAAWIRRVPLRRG
jgi:coenzyme F420 biosynthesis associated uncharacterized protein